MQRRGQVAKLALGFCSAAALLAACDGGEVARPGTRHVATARATATDSGGDGRTASSEAGAVTCNSCVVDTDCWNQCPLPSLSGYVWCCGGGVCFTWANACPPLSVDAGSSGSGDGPLDSGLDGAPDDGGLLNAPPDCQPSGLHGGHRWQDLYACYFGPMGNVSCGSMAGCHSQASDNGAMSSHFVCNPTSDACWQSLTTSIVVSDGAADPTMARLYSVLCKSDGSGAMPPACPNRLLTGDMARIAAWIREGAPND